MSLPTALTLGQHRPVAIAVAAQLASLITVVAFWLPVEQGAFTKTAILNALNLPHPRPKVLLVGGGFTEDEVAIALEAFEEYKKQEGNAAAVAVTVKPGTLEEGGPPLIVKRLKEDLAKALA